MVVGVTAAVSVVVGVTVAVSVVVGVTAAVVSVVVGVTAALVSVPPSIPVVIGVVGTISSISVVVRLFSVTDRVGNSVVTTSGEGTCLSHLSSLLLVFEVFVCEVFVRGVVGRVRLRDLSQSSTLRGRVLHCCGRTLSIPSSSSVRLVFLVLVLASGWSGRGRWWEGW